MQKIAVFGAGSTGCYLGTQLVLAGFDVSLVCREHLKQDIIENNGITISDYLGNRHHTIPPKLHTKPDNTQYDLIFITVKCHQLHAIVTDLINITHSKSTLIFMQNGIGSFDEIKPVLINRHCHFGITQFNIVRQNKTTFHKSTEGGFVFKKMPHTEIIQEKLAHKNFDCLLEDNMQATINGKLLLNLNNALNAISNIPIKQQLENKKNRRLLAAAMHEWLSVTKAMKAQLKTPTSVRPNVIPFILSLPNWLFKRLAKKMINIDPHARSSMWDDIQLGKKTEIDYLNGAVVRIGKQHDIETPVNQYIVKQIKQLEKTGRYESAY